MKPRILIKTIYLGPLELTLVLSWDCYCHMEKIQLPTKQGKCIKIKQMYEAVDNAKNTKMKGYCNLRKSAAKPHYTQWPLCELETNLQVQ